MKLAALYLFSVGVMLAICLAVHFLDEFRGDGIRSDEGPGDGEGSFHSTGVTDEGQHNHV